MTLRNKYNYSQMKISKQRNWQKSNLNNILFLKDKRQSKLEEFMMSSLRKWQLTKIKYFREIYLMIIRTNLFSTTLEELLAMISIRFRDNQSNTKGKQWLQDLHQELRKKKECSRERVPTLIMPRGCKLWECHVETLENWRTTGDRTTSRN